MSNDHRIYLANLLAGVISEVSFVSTSRDYLRVRVNKISFGLVVSEVFPNQSYEKGGYYHIQHFTLGHPISVDLANKADKMLVENARKVVDYADKLLLKPWIKI